jgi:WD40 repeat protein
LLWRESPVTTARPTDGRGEAGQSEPGVAVSPETTLSLPPDANAATGAVGAPPESIHRGHSGIVWAVAFGPDPAGRWVASAGEYSAVKVWYSQTARFSATSAATRASSPTWRSARLLISGSRDRTVRVWDFSHAEKNALDP